MLPICGAKLGSVGYQRAVQLLGALHGIRSLAKFSSPLFGTTRGAYPSASFNVRANALPPTAIRARRLFLLRN